jgi:ribonuclease HI
MAKAKRRQGLVKKQTEPGSRISTGRPQSPDKVTDLTGLRRYFDIRNDGWDVLIVCDGSGTQWGQAWGCGSVVIQKDVIERPLLWAGGNSGTNNTSELMGVFYPLLWLVSQQVGNREGGCQVHIISDSNYVVSGVNDNEFLTTRRLAKNNALWLAIHAVKRQGLILQAHHVRRDTLDLNKLCHDLANVSRRAQQGLLKEFPWDPHTCSPG